MARRGGSRHDNPKPPRSRTSSICPPAESRRSRDFERQWSRLPFGRYALPPPDSPQKNPREGWRRRERNTRNLWKSTPSRNGRETDPKHAQEQIGGILTHRPPNSSKLGQDVAVEPADLDQLRPNFGEKGVEHRPGPGQHWRGYGHNVWPACEDFSQTAAVVG